MDLAILSTIFDKRVNAFNILVEISIQDYLETARKIINKNYFQRKRITTSFTTYSLLKKDLEKGCVIPAIVLAHIPNSQNEAGNADKKITDDALNKIFKSEDLIILDGLQRTYTIMDLDDDLKSKTPEEKNIFLKSKIRLEIYIGMNRLSILYRTLTLNTGQTPMTLRHQIEILYNDFPTTYEKDKISLFKEVDTNRPGRIGEYNFKYILDGFQSYLDQNELLIDRGELLESLKRLDEENQNTFNSVDLFESFLKTYHGFVKKMDAISSGWVCSEELAVRFNKNPFGKDTYEIFSKAQPITGFGAAIGILKDNKFISGLEDISDLVEKISLKKSPEETFSYFLETLDKVKQNAKKIGDEQRKFFRFFFRNLFMKEGDSFLDFEKSIKDAYRAYNI